jgi:hypothetical protein
MDWPYGEFFTRCSDIFGYTDTNKKFLELTEVSMDGGDEQKAAVGQVERWKSRSARVPVDTLYVKVGWVWHTSKNGYFFETYTVDELKALPKPSKSPYRSTIYRSNQGDTEYAMAEWQFSPVGDLIGCVLTCKARDNAEPTSKCVAITLGPLAGGEVTTLSEGSFREYGPEGGIAQYEAAVNQFNEARPKAKIGGDSGRKARAFQSTGDLPAILWVTAPLQCTESRRDGNGKGQDWFTNEVSLYNTSKEAFLLTHVKVEYRFVGQKEFKPVNGLSISRAQTFVPSACAPLCQFPLVLQFGLPSDGPPNFHGSRGRSLCAGQAPIRIRLSASDLEGATVSLVQEFLNAPVNVEGPKPEDALFVYADNVVSEERASVHCTITNSDQLKVSVGSSSIDEDRLRKLAGEACAKKVSELPFSDLSSNWSAYKYGATALVDRSCQRVWAIKVDIARTDCESQGSGLMVLPLYGKTTPTRAVSFAVPSQVEAKEGESKSNTAGANADDTFDDQPASFVRNMRASAPSSMEHIQRSLQNLEVQLQRIADSIKK